MIRIGILGTGFGARVHLPAFNLDPRAKVTAVYGRDQNKVEKIANDNKIKAYTNWREMLETDDIDAIAIALPPPAQVEVLKEISQYKKHVFIEKPVGLGSSASLELAHALDRQKLIHSLDFEFPFLPAWQDFYQKKADLGELQHLKLNWHVRTTAYSGPETWKSHPTQGGGVLSNLACHSFHYTEWIMGDTHSVTAVLSSDEAQVDAILEFKNGKKASLSVSMNTPFGNGHRLELFGIKGALTLENVSGDYMSNFNLKTKNSLGEKNESYPVDEKFADGRVIAVNRVATRFIDAIEKGESVWPNLYDGYRNELLIEAVRKSHTTGQRIKM